MDTTRYMVVAKGEVITKKVFSCIINSDTKKYDITFDFFIIKRDLDRLSNLWSCLLRSTLYGNQRF